MIAVEHIEILPDFMLRLHFNDGIERTISFLPYIQKGFARQLLDPNYFSQVKIESGGGIEWPNGYDFCPNFLHDVISETESILA